MSTPYSEDLRKRVIDSIKNGMPVKDAVKTFKLSKSAIYTWLKRLKETGSYKAYDSNAGRKEILSIEQKEAIRILIIEKPDITLEEIKNELDLSICISALCRIINNKLKLYYKKKPIWK
jgi:transposase